MTHRERLIKTLKCEEIGGRVPHFEIAFYLTMELLGKVHPQHRDYSQWNQMSKTEQKLIIEDTADIFIAIAEKYDHSAIFVNPNPFTAENAVRLCEKIREKTGDKYFLLTHGDPTWGIPNGDEMMDFSVMMFEEPEKLNDISKRRLEERVSFAEELDRRGHLLDGFALCSDYCFNANPFFSPEQFDELIAPFLSQVITEYRNMGYYSIKHTDGNVLPILDRIAQCKPDAIHSLDPQGGVSLREARRIVGDKIALMGNVNCGLMQTGSEEELEADVLRSLSEGMEAGKGYIFSTSNTVYTGMPLERYELMWRIWQEKGIYREG